jgi:hypothetical protein
MWSRSAPPEGACDGGVVAEWGGARAHVGRR